MECFIFHALVKFEDPNWHLFISFIILIFQIISVYYELLKIFPAIFRYHEFKEKLDEHILYSF